MSKLHIDFSKHGPTTKEIQILKKICRECGRERKIPNIFCTLCWREMYATINKDVKRG